METKRHQEQISKNRDRSTDWLATQNSRWKELFKFLDPRPCIHRWAEDISLRLPRSKTLGWCMRRTKSDIENGPIRWSKHWGKGLFVILLPILESARILLRTQGGEINMTRHEIEIMIESSMSPRTSTDSKLTLLTNPLALLLWKGYSDCVLTVITTLRLLQICTARMGIRSPEIAI